MPCPLCPLDITAFLTGFDRLWVTHPEPFTSGSISGCGYYPDFLTPEEEAQVVALCDERPWVQAIHRRCTLSFGVQFELCAAPPSLRQRERSVPLSLCLIAFPPSLLPSFLPSFRQQFYGEVYYHTAQALELRFYYYYHIWTCNPRFCSLIRSTITRPKPTHWSSRWKTQSVARYVWPALRLSFHSEIVIIPPMVGKVALASIASIWLALTGSGRGWSPENGGGDASGRGSTLHRCMTSRD